MYNISMLTEDGGLKVLKYCDSYQEANDYIELYWNQYPNAAIDIYPC